jgi:hypothetical protein
LLAGVDTPVLATKPLAVEESCASALCAQVRTAWPVDRGRSAGTITDLKNSRKLKESPDDE